MDAPIKFVCPACQKKIRVSASHAGKKGVCPACKQAVQIPAASTTPETPPAADAKPDVPSQDKAPVASELPAKPVAAVASEKPAETAPPAEKPDAPAEKPAEKPTASADADKPKPSFIRFACPGCAKSIGFPADLAGQPATCPSCRARVMVPSAQGEESFIVGGPADEKPSAPKPVSARAAVNAGKPPAPPPRIVKMPGSSPVLPAAERAASSSRFIAAVAAAVILAVLLAIAVVILRGSKDASGESTTVARSDTPVPSPTPPVSARTDLKPATVEPATSSSPLEKGEIQRGAPKPEPPASPLPADKVETPTKPEMLAPAEQPKVEPSATLPSDKGEPAPNSTVQPPPDDIVVTKTKTEPEPLDDMDDELLSKKKKEPPARVEQPEVKPPPPPNSLPLDKGEIQRGLPPKDVAPVAAPAPVCAFCMGAGTLPIIPARPAYVRLNTDPPPDPALAVPWIHCTRCQAGKDPKALVQAETERLIGADIKRQTWEQLSDLKFLDVETRHVTLHTQLPPVTARNVGNYLDKLITHLQGLTRTTVFAQARPNTHELLILWDQPSFLKFIDAMERQSPGDHWALARKSVGGMGRHLGYFNANRGANSGPEHMALFQFSKMLMEEATDGKAPPWLAEGFAAYCENAITQQNLCYSFTYEMNEVRFGKNWDADIKKFALQSKLKTWDLIFPLNLIGMKSLDYLTCYSMVSYLIKADPKRFTQLALAIRDGLDSAKAVEKAYGRPVKEIQNSWGQWTLR